MSSIIGYYTTRFGELWDMSLYDLVEEAVLGVFKETKLEKEDIDAVFFGNMLGGVLENNLHSPSRISELFGNNLPVFRCEAACASGGVAFHLAHQYLLAQKEATVLVVGAEKMTDHSSCRVVTGLSAAASGEEQETGLTFPGLYGLLARVYLDTYHYSEENLAYVSVKNHYHATLNDKAQFQLAVTLDDVLHSSYVAEPLKVLDSSPISDGAAALIMTNSKKILSEASVSCNILATETASDTIGLNNRERLDELIATKIAADKAFSKARISRKDIQVAEVHDCFTIAELLAMEDLGFWRKGSAGKRIEELPTMYRNDKRCNKRSGKKNDNVKVKGSGKKNDKRISKGSNNGNGLIVNTSGGLKASGHPVGATGVKQIGEIFLQLTDQAHKRQVKNARYGLAHNVGGSGGTAVVTILGQ